MPEQDEPASAAAPDAAALQAENDRLRKFNDIIYNGLLGMTRIVQQSNRQDLMQDADALLGLVLRLKRDLGGPDGGVSADVCRTTPSPGFFRRLAQRARRLGTASRR